MIRRRVRRAAPLLSLVLPGCLLGAFPTRARDGATSVDAPADEATTDGAPADDATTDDVRGGDGDAASALDTGSRRDVVTVSDVVRVDAPPVRDASGSDGGINPRGTITILGDTVSDQRSPKFQIVARFGPPAVFDGVYCSSAIPIGPCVRYECGAPSSGPTGVTAGVLQIFAWVNFLVPPITPGPFYATNYTPTAAWSSGSAITATGGVDGGVPAFRLNVGAPGVVFVNRPPQPPGATIAQSRNAPMLFAWSSPAEVPATQPVQVRIVSQVDGPALRHALVCSAVAGNQQLEVPAPALASLPVGMANVQVAGATSTFQLIQGWTITLNTRTLAAVASMSGAASWPMDLN